MKKFLFPALALGALTMASCSSEEPMAGAAQDGAVTMTVVIPGSMQSRATLGDQIMAAADNLQWTVYEVDENGENPVMIYSDSKPAFTAEADLSVTDAATKATVTLNLGKGKRYKVAFYADNSGNGFATYNATTGNVEVDYTKGVGNDVNEDVFVGVSETVEAGTTIPATVELTRPFAQLNWGSNDLAEQTVKYWVGNETSPLTATVTVTGAVYNQYSVINEAVTGTAVTTATELGSAVVSDFKNYTQTVTFPVENYDLVAMNYVLVDAEAPTFECAVAFNDGFKTVTVNSVTMLPNYRTNIYGALLTNPTEFNVEINPIFNKEDNNMPVVAPGVTASTTDANTYYLSSVDGLKWLSEQAASSQLKGQTFILDADIDMTGVEWEPIGANGTVHWFTGTFDGNGHKISNMTVSNPNSAGLFYSNGGTIKNLTLENPTVNGNFKVGAVAGDGLCGHFDNCTVIGGTITTAPRLVNGAYDDGNNAGAITGYLSAEPNASITNCTVSGVTVKAYRVVGAIAGTVGGSKVVVSGNTATTCTVIADQRGDDNYGAKPFLAGELFGRVINGAVEGEGNVATGVKVETYAPAN